MKCMTRISVAVIAALALGACVESGSYLYGESWEGRPLTLHSDQVGVYPDQSVLDDPNNPFALAAPSDDEKWVFNDEAGNVVAFYSWATVLALRPTGEAQFYTASKLDDIYNNGEAEQADLVTVRQLAIDAYQAVLDHFPDAVSFDATGTFAFDLVTPSYQAIIDLGGSPQGGWILVQTAQGGPRAVQP